MVLAKAWPNKIEPTRSDMPLPDSDFTGRSAVVTGGAQGIGAAICARLGQRGAAVVIADLNDEKADEYAKAITRSGPGRAIALHCDVTSEADVTAAANAALDLTGALDGWVNNAGVTRDATLRKMSLDDFKFVLEVHLVGGWLGTRAAAAIMRDQRSGSIVNLSSMSGKVGNIGQTNYSAAKAGLIGLTKAASKELGHVGVRVNAIQPGVIKTPMTSVMRPDILEARLKEIPLGRLGEPDEVASVAIFLLSDASSYMTGNVVEIAGGRHM
jgi:3-oxoacyl-[acyl-carrier protein] reductase